MVRVRVNQFPEKTKIRFIREINCDGKFVVLFFLKIDYRPHNIRAPICNLFILGIANFYAFLRVRRINIEIKKRSAISSQKLTKIAAKTPFILKPC